MRYEEYKQTNVFWLPEIPAAWEWLLLSQTAKEQCIKKPQGAAFNVMSLSYGSVIRKRNIDAGLVPANYDNYQVIQAGNIILRLTDLQNDHTSLRTGLVKEDGIITSAYTCLAPTENSAYLQYLLYAYDIRKIFYGMGGGVRQSIGYKDIRNMRIPVPPLEEQDQIVRYLDWQVSKITKLITAKKKQIALLNEHRSVVLNTVVTRGLKSNRPLKRSGMKWLPQIPADWETIPAKALFSCMHDLRQESDEMMAATQKYGIIAQKKYMELEGRRIVLANDSLDKWLHVEPNDFIISLRSFQGGLEKCTETGCVTWHYVVLRPNSDVFPEFYRWFFKSSSYISALQHTSDFIRDGQDLRYSNFVKVRLLKIPLQEQVEISKYLEQTIPKYDNSIAGKEKEIAYLHELRTRLISDVVTGQINVRNVVIPEYESVEEDMSEDEFTDDELEISEVE